MPDEFVTVYLLETGEPTQMHSIDAAEAVRIGDYSLQPPKGTELDAVEMAQMRTRAAGIGTSTHPELQTPEQRAESRRLANEAAADLATRQRVMQGLPPVATTVPAPGPVVEPATPHVAGSRAHPSRATDKD